MAGRRMMRRGFRRRKKPQYLWDTPYVAQANLPQVVISNTELNEAAMTGLTRYTGVDGLIRRSIGATLTRISIAHGTNPSADAALELCIGLGFSDFQSVTDGQAVNDVLASGMGPLMDADNSRWFIRCCVVIPYGQLVSLGAAAANLVLPLKDGYIAIPQGNPDPQEISWYCTFDTKAIRKLHGFESEWLNIALEARTSETPAVGDSITCSMESHLHRHVLQVLT